MWLDARSNQCVDQGISRKRPILHGATLQPMVEVGRYQTRTDAEFARSLLAAAGIPSVLAPDESGGYPVDLSGVARLLVAEADADDAVVILRHHAHRR
jgi:Putative prokaryotic signal transducing protein